MWNETTVVRFEGTALEFSWETKQTYKIPKSCQLGKGQRIEVRDLHSIIQEVGLLIQVMFSIMAFARLVTADIFFATCRQVNVDNLSAVEWFLLLQNSLKCTSVWVLQLGISGMRVTVRLC